MIQPLPLFQPVLAQFGLRRYHGGREAGQFATAPVGGSGYLTMFYVTAFGIKYGHGSSEWQNGFGGFQSIGDVGHGERVFLQARHLVGSDGNVDGDTGPAFEDLGRQHPQFQLDIGHVGIKLWRELLDFYADTGNAHGQNYAHAKHQQGDRDGGAFGVGGGSVDQRGSAGDQVAEKPAGGFGQLLDRGYATGDAGGLGQDIATCKIVCGVELQGKFVGLFGS